MDVKILNTSYQVVGMVDYASSIRWTERYNEPGDFEVYTPVTKELLNLFQLDYYVQIPNSEYTMIVENREIKSSSDGGNMLVISGRSLESILDRRIVWIRTTVFELDPELALKRIIGDQLKNGIPLNSLRGIPNFDFIEMSDAYIKSLQMTAQYQTDQNDVLDITMAIAKKFDFGFKITLNSSNNHFEFRAYSGKDRSYSQPTPTNSFVVFSPAFDNLISSNYFESTRIYKSSTRVVGDEAGTEYEYRAYAANPQTGGLEIGLAKKETFTDASDLTRISDDADYQDKLTNRGEEDLAKNYRIIRQLDAQIDVLHTFKYRTDFFLGDIIQIENDYGIKGTAKVIEMTHSENLSGFNQYPTLEYL